MIFIFNNYSNIESLYTITNHPVWSTIIDTLTNLNFKLVIYRKINYLNDDKKKIILDFIIENYNHIDKNNLINTYNYIFKTSNDKIFCIYDINNVLISIGFINDKVLSFQYNFFSIYCVLTSFATSIHKRKLGLMQLIFKACEAFIIEKYNYKKNKLNKKCDITFFYYIDNYKGEQTDKLFAVAIKRNYKYISYNYNRNQYNFIKIINNNKFMNKLYI